MLINRLVVEGYKSFKERTELKLATLTVLAGANSSGKSSIMQPALLLKQTFEAGYDPGPLLISGPNVVFSETDQMLWSAPAEPRSIGFRWGLEVNSRGKTFGVEVQLCQQKDAPTPLVIRECVWSVGEKNYSLRESMLPQEIESVLSLSDDLKERLSSLFPDEEDSNGKHASSVMFSIRRNRALLSAYVDTPVIAFPLVPDPIDPGVIDKAVRQIIHVPGLRGNPRRTYPVSAVEDEYQGLFQDYVASIIARWQKGDRAKLNQIGTDLHALGLTWKVRAEKRSDTEVELLVGRLPVSRRGGSRDLVSIADVGFGFSQTLPVVVALLTASSDQLVYLEQPEIHLHPRAQFALADLIQRAIARGVQVVVETHSELLLIGIQKLVAEGKLLPSQTQLHWFTRDQYGGTQIISSNFDEHGAFGDVPVDFSDVNMMALRQYLTSATPGR